MDKGKSPVELLALPQTVLTTLPSSTIYLEAKRVNSKTNMAVAGS